MSKKKPELSLESDTVVDTSAGGALTLDVIEDAISAIQNSETVWAEDELYMILPEDVAKYVFGDEYDSLVESGFLVISKPIKEEK